MQETSISLLKRIADEGTDDDWQRLLEIYRPFMYQRISTYPLLVNQAEDIVQEVLVVLVRELPTFQRQRAGSFRAFLRGIVLNQLRYAMRRVQKTPLVAGQYDKLNDQIEQLADPNSQLSVEFDRQHDRSVFRHAASIVKNEVKASTWQAFQKHAIEGKSAPAVAEELGVSVNVVLLAKSRLTRRIREEIRGLVD
ncbi:sigma-70 family RNA polymerase sigma factor [Stieleria sp. ICT_E10.1]|uniref:RNA polymerase sigma factor n=1 Tax=Stieleria sedimenti TaxID=2976331 RepID=UPI0021804BD9|nr:sigma-70 family RNA polymerase sigma factor [Stieleria sedimenti]MCS7468809.1 sigma-70 family RNA polymerase sigma factor [Stieleria sedimenti]